MGSQRGGRWTRDGEKWMEGEMLEMGRVGGRLRVQVWGGQLGLSGPTSEIGFWARQKRDHPHLDLLG